VFYNKYSFIIEVENESLITKHWSRIKILNAEIIENIVIQDLIRYHNAKIKVIQEIYWEESIIDNPDIIKGLLNRKELSSDTTQIKTIKNKINFVHPLSLMKNELKKYVKNKDIFALFLEFKEPMLFRYHKRKKDDD
jgi:hypothetical protein